MLNIVKYAQKVAKQFTLTDWTVAKIDLVVIGLLLAKLFPVLTSLHRWFYVVIIIAGEIYFINRIKNMKR